VRFLDVIQGLRNIARREGLISAARVANLDRGERLLQELRRRLISQILSGPEEMEIKAAMARIINGLDQD
jgi:hypothetical protein